MTDRNGNPVPESDYEDPIWRTYKVYYNDKEDNDEFTILNELEALQEISATVKWEREKTDRQFHGYFHPFHPGYHDFISRDFRLSRIRMQDNGEKESNYNKGTFDNGAC